MENNVSFAKKIFGAVSLDRKTINFIENMVLMSILAPINSRVTSLEQLSLAEFSSG